MFELLMQATQPVTGPPANGMIDRLKEIGISSPQELLYGYLLILLLLWLLARRGRERKKDFSAEAQKVLDEKFKKGEIDLQTYEKYRQELSMRLKKE